MSNEDKGDGPAFSEMMIRRHEDMEPAAGAEAPAAESEAREEMTEARRSRPRGARRSGARGGGGGRANAGNKKPKKGAAAVTAVADRCVRELVPSNLTSHEHSAALEALFPEAASEVAAAAADGGGGGWQETQ